MPSAALTRRDCLAAAAAAVFVFLVFIPTLSSGFVNLDDHGYVKQNTLIESIDLAFFKSIFTVPVINNWHPLTVFTLAIDYAVWGRDPFGYHLVNIIWHSLNTFLVFVLTFRLASINEAARKGAMPFVAGSLAALLFGIHPQHVESVSWISERKDVLYSFFFLLSVLAYVRYAAREKAWTLYYAAAFLSFALSLMSKPMAITLPIVLLILDYFPLKRLTLRGLPRLIFEKLPFFALMPLSAAATVLSKGSGDILPLEIYSMPFRLVVVCKAYVFYLSKMILPVGLSAYYPLLSDTGKFTPSFIVYPIILASVTVFCVLMAKRSRSYLAAWAFFVATLLPVIGLVQVGGQFAADRYMYMPALGFMMLAGAGAGRLYEALPRARAGLIAAGLVLIAILTFMNIRQQAIWKSPVAMWEGGLKNISEVYFDRATIFKAKGDYTMAIGFYNWVITFDPGHAEANFKLGESYAMIGEYDRSIEAFKKVLAADPSDASVHNYLSKLYYLKGDYDMAVRHMRNAEELGYRPDERKELP